ncbi:hypothetical protein [Roseovarius sp. D22-M7]|uniref:hypothetical protein n=1 Tax=Roseovarius sp. D22-M7 TaxID=3127116 RepID=UPI00300F9E1C
MEHYDAAWGGRQPLHLPTSRQDPRGQIEGLECVGHGMADAACDADHLRRFVTHNLEASAQLEQNLL